MSYHVKNIPHFNPIALTPKEFESYLIPLDLSLVPEKDLLQTARDYLEKSTATIISMMKNQILPTDLHRVRSRMMDRLIEELFNRYQNELCIEGVVASQVCVFFATGGYGREEMSLLSDIDLLLCYRSHLNEICKPLIEKILYILWDLKLDVGHAVRSLDECKKMMLHDQTILTAMLDVRRIIGDEGIASEVYHMRETILADDVFRRRMIQAKINERNLRLERFGGSVYLLEPHVKEGEGGLRDLQLMRWLAQILGHEGSFEGLRAAGFIDETQAQCLHLGFNYLLLLRNRLHVLTKTKKDQINFEAQIEFARELGFKDDEVSLAVEQFMRTYYALANQSKINIKNLIQKVISQQKSTKFSLFPPKIKKLDDYFKVIDGKIALIDDDLFQKTPKALMWVFEQVQKTGMGLHFQTREMIVRHLDQVDDAFRTDPDNAACFRRMMGTYKNLGKALLAMHEVHFFDALIPEFKTIRDRMHHDAYHVYTVDAHSIIAVNELSNLVTRSNYQENFYHFKEIVAQLKRPDLLSFGLLLHDVGKGRGGDHSNKGADIAKTVMHRFGYSDEDSEKVEFQVRTHLQMSHLSQRRDLEDYNMINEFARAMQSTDRLSMLYVLTWADIRAVSAEAWTAWKGELLHKLYLRTKEALDSHEVSEDVVRKKVAAVQKQITHKVKASLNEADLQKFLKSISPRYILAHSADEIFEHYKMIAAYDDSSLLFVHKIHKMSPETTSEVMIYTWLNPRVIPIVTGVMLSLDINVLAMENFMFSDGHVLIKMSVQSQNESNLAKAGVVQILKDRLGDVFKGRTTVSTLLAKRKKPAFLTKKMLKQAKTHIHIDNDVSAYYTVIDIHTYDRLGLLYDMAKCLVEQGCYVDVSKISTRVDWVIDSFYLKDIFGHKITSKLKLNEIKQALSQVIEDVK